MAETELLSGAELAWVWLGAGAVVSGRMPVSAALAADCFEGLALDDRACVRGVASAMRCGGGTGLESVGTSAIEVEAVVAAATEGFDGFVDSRVFSPTRIANAKMPASNPTPATKRPIRIW